MRRLIAFLLVFGFLCSAGPAFSDVVTVVRVVTPEPAVTGTPTPEPVSPTPVVTQTPSPEPASPAPAAAGTPAPEPADTGTPSPETPLPDAVVTETPAAEAPGAYYPAPEVPPAERVHVRPADASGSSSILDTTRDRNCLDGFHFKLDAEFLHIWFPIIANADEAVITFGDEVWLIDCGDKGMGLRGVHMLQELGITKIDKLFNSHPHYDHIDGLQVTHEAAPVGELLFCFPEDSGETIANAVAYAKSENIPVRHYGNGDVFTMGNGKVSLKFYCPEDDSLDMNNSSALTLLEYGSRRMLFTGDMERPGQEAILSRVKPGELRAEILKYPHHGKTGLLEEFYQEVNPSLAIITNVHVDWAGVNYLIWKSVPYIFTCTTDTYVHLYTDGNTWVVERVLMGFSESGS